MLHWIALNWLDELFQMRDETFSRNASKLICHCSALWGQSRSSATLGPGSFNQSKRDSTWRASRTVQSPKGGKGGLMTWTKGKKHISKSIRHLLRASFCPECWRIFEKKKLGLVFHWQRDQVANIKQFCLGLQNCGKWQTCARKCVTADLKDEGSAAHSRTQVWNAEITYRRTYHGQFEDFMQRNSYTAILSQRTEWLTQYMSQTPTKNRKKYVKWRQ